MNVNAENAPNENSPTDDVTTQKKKKFSCEKCGKKFTRKGDVARHQQKRKFACDKPNYKCKRCDRPFVRKYLYEKHIYRRKPCQGKLFSKILGVLKMFYEKYNFQIEFDSALKNLLKKIDPCYYRDVLFIITTKLPEGNKKYMMYLAFEKCTGEVEVTDDINEQLELNIKHRTIITKPTEIFEKMGEIYDIDYKIPLFKEEMQRLLNLIDKGYGLYENLIKYFDQLPETQKSLEIQIAFLHEIIQFQQESGDEIKKELEILQFSKILDQKVNLFGELLIQSFQNESKDKIKVV